MSALYSRSTRPRGAREACLTAVAALIGAACLAGPLSAVAQTEPVHHYHHAVASADGPKESIDDRIVALHSQLQITLDEESKWAAVAQVMRDNDAEMHRMIAEKRSEPPHSVTAVEDLKTYEHFTQAHVNGLKNLISSFETLYAAMPAPQQAIADHVFQHFGSRDHAVKS